MESVKRESSPPAISVLLVTDYGAGDAGSWATLRSTLRALARQTYTGPVECLLVEHEGTASTMPADVPALLPSLRILRSPETGSYGLKNHGVRESRAPVIVILDADCRPDPDWLQRIAAAWNAHPGAAVISGRTMYEGRGTMERLSALLSRAYVDRGTAGRTRHISNNNASWRRQVYLKHPLPTHLGPFASRMQSEAILRDGGELLFVPDIRVTHAFEGWAMDADIRRNCGYGTVVTRLEDPAMPWARLIRMGRLSIPFIWAGKTLDLWQDILRCWRHFRVRPVELPLAMTLAPVMIAMEVPGMLAAYGHRSVGPTEYR